MRATIAGGGGDGAQHWGASARGFLRVRSRVRRIGETIGRAPSVRIALEGARRLCNAHDDQRLTYHPLERAASVRGAGIGVFGGSSVLDPA